jgi:L-threonylcarbamoyladenylate synthase
MQGMGQVLTIESAERFRAAVEAAVAVLKSGGLVALPTETVYGLAANATDPAAVARIFAIKGRPAHNPVIVHVSSVAMARACAARWPATADKLAAAFWPGPLTLVLPRSALVPDIVTAGGSTVGLRWPQHPFIQAVIQAAGFPLAAPSANPSNRLSPTSAEHVRRHLGARLRLIVDGGPCAIGVESTVLDLTVDPPRVLRPGVVHEAALEAVVGRLALNREPSPDSALPAAALKSPGMLSRHYAPRARLLLLSWRGGRDLLSALEEWGIDRARVRVLCHEHVPAEFSGHQVSVVPHDAAAYARALYAELHRCDDAEVDCIVVETPPCGPDWAVIHDRLRRASA